MITRRKIKDSMGEERNGLEKLQIRMHSRISMQQWQNEAKESYNKGVEVCDQEEEVRNKEQEEFDKEYEV